MSEKQARTEKTDRAPEAAERRTEILVALIQHGSRPAAALLIGLLVAGWLFAVKDPLLDLLQRAQKIKYGPLEVELAERAALADVSAELKSLARLTDEQLQLFLVIGKYRSHIRYDGQEVTEPNLERLRELGILARWEKRESGDLWWQVSEEGHRLHDIVRNLVFVSMRRSAAE